MIRDVLSSSRNIILKKGMKVRFIVVREPSQGEEQAAYNNGRGQDVRFSVNLEYAKTLKNK